MQRGQRNSNKKREKKQAVHQDQFTHVQHDTFEMFTQLCEL